MKNLVPRPRPSAGKNKNCKVGDGWASNSISSTALFLLPKRTTGIDHASLCQPEHNLNYLAGGEPVLLGSGDYFPKVVSSLTGSMSGKPAGILYTPQGQKTYRYNGCTLSVVGKPRFPNDRALVVKCGDPKGSFLVGRRLK